MTNLTLGRRLVALAATLLVSATCVIGAVGPATAGQSATVVTAARA